MIEFMIYPVSAIMKFWHYLLHSVCGLSTSTAWYLSIFALVITVRTIVAPLTWMQMKSGRVGQLLQPRLRQLKEEFELRTDADAVKWHQQQRKELHKKHSYNPAAGCAPALIQIPVLLGLYQVLLRMARPAEGLAADHRPIGYLSPQDIAEFVQTRVAGVPLPAYANMSPEQFAALGTTREDALAIVTPLILAACLFTAINMAFSTWRNYRTLDWSSGFAVGMAKFVALFIVLAPIMLLVSAYTAPLPLAIMLYWFGGNLWTMAQFFVFTWWLEKKLPLTQEFIERWESTKAAHKAHKARKRSRRRLVARKRMAMVAQPQRFGEIKREVKNLKAGWWAEHEEENRDRKDRAKQRRLAQREAQRERIMQKRAERQAKQRAAQDQME